MANEPHEFVARHGAQNGWNEWSRHVLAELKRLNEQHREHAESTDANFKEIRNAQSKQNTDIALLQLKATMGGVIASLLVTLIMNYLRTRL